MPFLNKLYAKHHAKHTWELTRTLRYVSKRTGKTYDVPKGFKTDFASAPIRLGIPKEATLHDYLYTGVVPRSEADKEFYNAMVGEGVNRILAMDRYLAVRAMGWRHYQK